MRKTNTQKGITLIALIITIVVLLILASVTISSIQNDGILHYAQNAAKDYNQASANEQGTLGGYLDLLNKYNNPEFDLLERYILGENKTGRLLTEIVDISTFKFIDEGSTIKDASTSVIGINYNLNEDGTEMIAKITYNNNEYKVIVDVSTCDLSTGDFSTARTKSISQFKWVPVEAGMVVDVGETVLYDSNGDTVLEEWIVLPRTGGRVEIVSKNIMYDAQGKGLTLGYGDTSVTVTSGMSAGAIAVASYNNAETTINSFCDSIVDTADGETVRSLTKNDYNDVIWNKLELGGWLASKGSVQWDPGVYGSNVSYCVYTSDGLDLSVSMMSNGIYLEQYNEDPLGYTRTRGVHPVVQNPATIYAYRCNFNGEMWMS